MDTRAIIPSLCASTASCGAAAIGYSFGQSHSAEKVTKDGTKSESFEPLTPATPRHSISVSRSHTFRSSILRRPQSATFTRIVPSWSPLHGDSPHIGGERPVDSSHSKVTSIERDISTQTGDSSGGVSRSLWPRRMSTIAQSQDGSTQSTTTRPSTPSLFSSGSNAPFLPSDQPVIPRNRLVKRSTSQRVLHSGSLQGSPFTAPQTPTFRRPATSHQRSEQLRIQNFRYGLDETPKDISEDQERLEESRDYFESKVEEEQNAESPDNNLPDTWLPYFRSQPTYIARESPLKTASGSRGNTYSDTISCVHVVAGRNPVLLKAHSVTKLPRDEPKVRPAILTSTPPAASISHKVSPNAAHKHISTEQVPKSRNSFSFGDIMSSPSPTWKIRGGSMRRKQGRDGTTSGRRVASAPQQGAREGKHPVGLLSAVQDTRVHEGSTGENGALEDDAHVEGIQQEPSSLPLPPLERLSAFDIDSLTRTSYDHSVPEPVTGSSPPMQSSPSSAPIFAGPSSSRIRIHRTSRVASDRDSTVFSSDNEQSRVFSADGDDADYRSETIFDSIRTDATGSSHSGARSQRIEAVFNETNGPEVTKYDLAALQEKLSGIPPTTQRRQDDLIPEEEESLRTPVRDAAEQEVNTATLSQQTQAVPPRAVSSSPPRVPVSTSRTQTKYSHFDDSEADDDWSMGEDNEEEAWDNGSLGISARPTLEVTGSSSTHANVTAGGQMMNLPLRPRSNVLEWSELQAMERDASPAASERPKTARPKQSNERGSRAAGRWGPGAVHIRSQSVPLPPESSNHRFNSASKLDAWILGGKGVSEDWDKDFEFDEADETEETALNDENTRNDAQKASDTPGVLVPPAILEKQASVHGQFGQVKELTLLVEELRRLRQSAQVHGLLQGQSAELWREAEGIIDLATLDEEESDFFVPHSPVSTNFDFDAFEEESPTLSRHRKSITATKDDLQIAIEANTSSPAPSRSSAGGSRFGTPTNRPRKESVAKAKHVLENIHQHRSSLDPIQIDSTTSSTKKLPFDTTSLRDLVTRAGVVTRALKEIIHRAENPDYIPQTPERRSATPPDPPFSQIFHQPSTPQSSKKSPRIVRRKSSNSFLPGSTSSNNDNDRNNGHMQIMTVV